MIYAMFAMILLTFIVGAQLFRLRLSAVKSGKISLGSFRLNNSAEVPTQMLQAMRNYSNLFEVPTLFYAAGVLTLALNFESVVLILLAWIFVLSRAIHSWIHLTYNNVIHRMQAFMVGNATVVLMWLVLVIKYSSHHVQG